LLRGLAIPNAAPFSAVAPAWQRFRAAMDRHYPGVLPADVAPASFPLPLAFYDAVSAVLQALDAARTDGPALVRELARVRLNTPAGPIRLDRNRQAVLDGYLSTLTAGPDGKPVFHTLRTLHDVDQSFGGYFTAHTPVPSSDGSDCRRATPPAWAR
jgi:branched-chain amino acid transport system substrate-binding protein